MTTPRVAQSDDSLAARPIVVGQDSGVRSIRLNRPQRRNALDPALVAALQTAVAEAGDDGSVRAVVIAGEGPTFCAGADLRHMLELAAAGETPMEFLSAVWRCFNTIEQLSVPVVAAVHGHAVAGGLELALACDAVVAAQGAALGDGHVRNGLLPGGGASYRLPRKVGESLARRLILTGELLPAESFLSSGFVHSVVATDELTAVATGLAGNLAGGGPGSVARIKRLLGPDPAQIDVAQKRELDSFAQNWQHHAVAESLRRFFERKE